MLLLHGFGEFWWAWRHQLPVARRGRVSVAALDLRGLRRDATRLPAATASRSPAPTSRRSSAASASPPRTSSGTTGVASPPGRPYAYAPEQVSGLATIAAPHPLRFPWRSMGPEPGLVPAADPARARDHGPRRCVRGVAAPASGRPAVGVPVDGRARHYRQALRLWPSPHCALEYLRMFGRDQLRAAGRDYRQALRSPVRVPVLTVRGSADRLLPASAMLPPRSVRADRSPARRDPRRRAPAARGGTRTRSRRRCWTGCPIG